jgi:hypothetical protein
VPPVAWALRWLRPVPLVVLGTGLIALSLFGLATVIGWQLVHWLPEVPQEFRRYFGQRVLFALATLPEAPIVPVGVAGVACWWAGKRRSRSKARAGGAQPSTVLNWLCGPLGVS